MSKVQMVRVLVNQRLTAAAEEIFGLFERTIAEYEEELCRSNEKNERQQKLLDAVLKPEVRLHIADIQQLVVVKEEVPPEQQEWSPSLDQEDPPEPPHIKEEQEELWTSLEGEQLQGLEEADITKFLFTPVPVKSEDDEEKPHSSQLHQRQTEQMETGADGEDCGGPELARNSHPDPELQPETEDSEDWNYTTEHESSVNLSKKPFSYSKCGFTKAESQKCVGPQSSQLHQQDETEDSSDTEDSDDWSKDIREPPSDSKSLKNRVSKSGARCNTKENPLSCSLCGKSFRGKKTLKLHLAVHTGEKRFCCSVCEKRFKWKRDMNVHMAVHTGEKRFSCSVCEKRFKRKQHLTQHMAIHTGQKPFKCSVCEKAFTQKGGLTLHLAVHTGEKPFKCSVCEKAFTQKRYFTLHMAIHRGEHSDDWSKETREPRSDSKSLNNNEVSKSGVRCNTEENPLSCSLCGKAFKGKTILKRHMVVHSGEKRFRCSVCEKRFKRKGDIKVHMAIHTGQKSFKCSVCEKAFTQKAYLTVHMANHRGEKRYCCSVCDQRFTWPFQLAKHKLVCPQSSQLHQTEQNREAEPGASSSTQQMETGADGEDCGGPEPARTSHPDPELQPETEDSEDWNYTTEHESSVNLSKKPFSYSKCGFTKAESQKCVGPQSSQLHQQDETEDSSDTEDSDDWSRDIREPPSDSKSLKNRVSKSGARCNTKENPLSCSLCGKAFRGKKTLKLHLAVHTGEKRFSCSVCEKRFKRKGDMKEHMAVHTGERRFSCSVCEKRFKRKQHLRQHMAIHTGQKPFKCSVCEKAFTQKRYFTLHMAIHRGEKRYCCSVCDQRFTWPFQLAKHKLVCPQSSQLHQTEQNREAEPGASSSTQQMETGADGEDCGGPEPARTSHPDPELQPETEDSEDGSDTTEHESSVHLSKCVSPQSSQLQQQDKTEDCSDTEHSDDWSNDIREPPSDSKSLKNNEVSPSGVRCNIKENPLSCSLCGKAFRGKSYLRQHMSVHTGEKRFSCSVCEKGFKRKQHLTQHMAVHTEEKRFSCSLCEKGFKRKAHLTQHLAIIHTGQKPFKCSVCEKGFSQKAFLTDHMAVHTGEKRFSCSVCEKRFKWKGEIKVHMAIHTGEKPFKCSVCEKAFTKKSSLTVHMANHTGEKRFCCSVCDQRFTWHCQLRRHKLVCPQSSQLQQTEQNREAEPGASSSTEQMETGADGEDCGGPEPARNSHPDL